MLADYGKALQEAYKSKVGGEEHSASGKLQRSVEWRIDHSGRHYIISLELEYYWRFLEDGRAPGKYPPVSKIREWVRVKPVVPRRDKNGRLPSIKQLAFLIARKIAEIGIEPTHILQRTIDEINAEYKDKISAAFAEDLQTSLRATFTDVFRQ